MDTAESMDAAVSVRPYIDNALMRHGQVLYRSILSNPLQWGDFATRLHSPTVLNDAVIHLVGKWNSLTKQEKRGMDNRLRAICERKAEQLYKIKGASEIRIAGHIPKACWRDASRDTISRVSYSNDVYMWMAIAIHHQWFHQVVGIERRGRDSPDGGAMLYKAIWEGNTSYLNAQDYANFHNLCPMSNKARTILYDKIRQMKSEVRKYVKNLVSNKTQLDLDALDAGEPIDHLLCTEMTLEDHPWNDSDSEAFVPPAFSDDEDDDEVEMEGGIPPGVAAHTFQTAFHPPSSEQTVEHS
ncbi:hypothetical protein BGW36DRAFT_371505 [Talaromyces proteolyticus]|uniref:Uncharacterized protein n=1 Tax=Talaromyces proteolyticus TaxID=1131652 RepID=A0AAD4KV26_9EURO|nr:uncharacterized protein BGW36DRAFT_371505 [Talaromyces proteolyticus]KAH8701757.1 hypothetical protein BGW36DRAFT_371505 [Talaromyces proteolyticus]